PGHWLHADRRSSFELPRPSRPATARHGIATFHCEIVSDRRRRTRDAGENVMRPALASTFALLFCAGSLASAAFAQPPDSLAKPPATLVATLMEGSGPTASSPDTPAPPVQAVRFDGPINVDGSLDEAAWQTAPVTSLFHQRDPVEWAAPSQRTEVRVGYD